MSEETKAIDLVDKKTGEILSEGTPEDLLLAARDAAQALERVIALNDKPPLVFNGKRYLEVHHWQTIGKFYHSTVSTSEPEFIEIDGIKGFRAKATVIDEKTGMVVGGATAFCMRDEKNWATKPIYALASMAQTRAMSKALSNKFRFVAVVAGYEGTPSEEIIDAGVTIPRQVQMPRTKSAPREPIQDAVAVPVETPPVHVPAEPQEGGKASSKFFDQLHKIAREKGLSAEKMKHAMVILFGKESSRDLTDAEAVQLIKLIEKGGIK